MLRLSRRERCSPRHASVFQQKQHFRTQAIGEGGKAREKIQAEQIGALKTELQTTKQKLSAAKTQLRAQELEDGKEKVEDKERQAKSKVRESERKVLSAEVDKAQREAEVMPPTKTKAFSVTASSGNAAVNPAELAQAHEAKSLDAVIAEAQRELSAAKADRSS